MKIIRFEAEHVKRLQAVEITPAGHVVEITGKNGQGKTSILDAIWWALAGTRSHQPEPINRDHDQARIKLDLGELVVERQFARLPPAPGRQDERLTTRIIVTDAEGHDLRSPQTILDRLLGSLAFDPLAFARKDEAEQYRVLQDVCGIDLRESDLQNEKDYTARRVATRTAKDRRAAAGHVQVPRPMPERVDVAGLLAERQRRDTVNAGIAESVKTREALERDHKDLGRALDTVLVGAVESEKAAVRREAELAADIKRVHEDAERQIASLKTSANLSIEGHRDLAESEKTKAQSMSAEWQALSKKIDDLPKPPAPEPLADIDEELLHADANNRAAEAAERMADNLKRLLAEAKSAEEESRTLTAAMDTRTLAAKEAVEKAALPIPGLELDHGRVTLNGLPFAQASDADQLRASCAIAMRGDQKLRVIRVRDGSLLDEDSMDILASMAADADYQVWVERVDSSGKVGIVIEDGLVKGDS